MIDLSPLGHAAVAVIVQVCIGMTCGLWAAGGAIGCMWFVAREHTQAEYRWIAQLGAGKRANMPWWGGFDWRVGICPACSTGLYRYWHVLWFILYPPFNSWRRY